MVLWTNFALVGLSFSAFVLASISLFSPWWYTEDPENLIGLFASCKADSFYRWKVKSCVWSHENLLEWTRKQPQWWQVCQTLMVLAVVTMALSLFINIHMAKKSEKFIAGYERSSTRIEIINGFFIVCAFVEILATVAHFGTWAHKEREVQVSKHAFRSFGWAYLLACLACLIQFAILLIFFVHIVLERRRRKKDAEYSASLAAQYGQQGYGPQGYGQYGYPNYPQFAAQQPY